MATIAALERVLNSLDAVPAESRDLIEWMNKLYLFYVKIGYLNEIDVYHPSTHGDSARELPDWHGIGWDERITDALPWLPARRGHDEGGKHITPGAFAWPFHGRGAARESRELHGHLDREGANLPAYALPLTDGQEFSNHWIWDAKDNLIRIWDYDVDIDRFEDLPSTSVAEKFSLFIHQIEDLEIAPWCGKLYSLPRLDVLRWARDDGQPDWSLDANTFIVAKTAYLRASWGGDGFAYDPNAFRLSDFLPVRDEWTRRMNAIPDGDEYGDWERAANDIATEMAGDEAYR